MSDNALPTHPVPPDISDEPAGDTTADKLAELHEHHRKARHAGSANAVEKQHERGKLTARERLGLLLDAGSFTELDELARHRSTVFGSGNSRPYGDGVITGYGSVNGRDVCVFAQDFTVFGGSLGEVFGAKIAKLMDLAAKIGCPIIGINDSGGARIQEGIVALAAYGEIFRRNVALSGVVPQISLVMGPCAGGAVYSPALTDFTVMVDKTSHMFITGPQVLKAVTGEDVSFEELGGARTHNSKSGNAHYLARDEADAIAYAKRLLSYLPSNNRAALAEHSSATHPMHVAREPERAAERHNVELSATDIELNAVIPDSPQQPYNMLSIIERIVDDSELCQVQELFARNIICGFGRIDGSPIGIVANQPLRLAGCLNIDAAEKAARFVRTCDAFGIPIVTLVDVPGFLPGKGQEWNGIIRRGAKLLYAYAEATVPKITIITRKAYGGAYDVMGSKHLGADINLGWPTAQLAVMGASGAVNVLYRSQLAQSDDPDKLREQLTQQYTQTLANPYIAAERGYLDAVIEPAQTRHEVARALRLLANKHETSPAKKHGNIPL
ncbi:MAG: methylmalonyl-CoA carboxyltransferase [Acidimicrobiales bacterium]|nr:MAG: methylmalonyl-CoA carboxyltransferase [Acidimicrobiales bacterium]